MGAITAAILIGQSHQNRGGNRAFAQIHLEEGDRPALALRWLCPPHDRGNESFRNFTMIPTLENALDDSILMVAYLIMRRPMSHER